MNKERFEESPCYLCGYNGPGYYQPDTHKCATLYHKNKLDCIAALEAELAKVRAERDEWKARIKQAQEMHDEMANKVRDLMQERDAAVAAWECAKRQNAHDMLLSGDEIHQHDAAINQARGIK